MADSHEKLDTLSSAPSQAEVQKGPKISENKDVKKGAESVLGSAESGETSEDGVEGGDGKVSESTSEDKSKQGQSSGGKGKAMTNDEKEQQKAKLLANPPLEREMIRQISKVLDKQKHKLEDEADSLLSSPQKNPSRLVEVIGKIRAINQHFESMVGATYEFLKHLWLKIVHGL